jgi:hypothetical protein
MVLLDWVSTREQSLGRIRVCAFGNGLLSAVVYQCLSVDLCTDELSDQL